MGGRGEDQDKDIGIVSDRLLDLLQDLRPSRIIGRPSTRQNEDTSAPFSDEPERVNDPNGVFKSVESGDLEQNRSIAWNIKVLQNRIDLFIGEILIFVAEGIDRRIDEVLRDRQSTGELGEGEDGGVIFRHILP